MQTFINSNWLEQHEWKCQEPDEKRGRFCYTRSSGREIINLSFKEGSACFEYKPNQMDNRYDWVNLELSNMKIDILIDFIKLHCGLKQQ